MTKTWMRRLAAITAMGVSLVAAGAGYAQEQITLYWALWDWDATAYYKPLIDAYQAKNPNVNRRSRVFSPGTRNAKIWYSHTGLEMTMPSVKEIWSIRSNELEIVGKMIAISLALPWASARRSTGSCSASHTNASVSHHPIAAPTTIARAEMKSRLRSSMRWAPSDIRFSRFFSSGYLYGVY